MMLRYVLSLSLVLNSLSTYAGPKEEAQKAINKSHEAARITAASLVQNDLDMLIGRIAQTQIYKNPMTANLLQEFASFEEQILNVSQKAKSIENMDVTAMKEIVKSYRGLVRERFRSSFKSQQLVYDREKAVRIFQLMFRDFNNLCATGRSDIGYSEELPILPRIPAPQFSIYVGGGVNNGGQGGSFEMRSSNLNANPESEKRAQAANVLYGATSIAGSIALSGGTGAAVAMAQAAAPFMMGASIAVLVVLTVMAAQEQVALENEMTQANVDLFLKSASDKDIAKYYQNYCKSVNRQFVAIEKKLSQFAYSEASRADVLEQVEKTRTERTEYLVESEKVREHADLAQLVKYDKNGACVAPSLQKADSLCTKSGTEVTWIMTKQKYDPAKPEDVKRFENSKAILVAFGDRYPQDKQLELQSDNIFELLLLEWENNTTQLNAMNYNAVDGILNGLADRVQSYIYEIQRYQNSSWVKGAELTGLEMRYQTEYSQLRKEFFNLVNTSILVIFNKADAQAAKKSFIEFEKKFNQFSSKAFLNSDVQSLSRSVKSLGSFYEKL